MNTDNSTFNMQDPELPRVFRDARRNHCGQTVPADFFAQFEKKINAVIDAEQLVKDAQGPVLVPQTKTETRTRGYKRWIGIAASVIVVVAVSIALQLGQGAQKVSPKSVDQFADVTRGALLEQIENIELPDQVADEVLAAASDYEIYDLYCCDL